MTTASRLVVGATGLTIFAAVGLAALDGGAPGAAPAPHAPPHARSVVLPVPRPAISVPTPAPAPAQSPQPLVIRHVLQIDGPIHYGEWHWDEAGAPAGPIIITVDLQARVLSIFRAGYEIGTSAVLVGAPEKPTPTGVFPITQKQVTHFSSLYGAAPMPYMERLTNDGVTLHASHVMNGYASHGCVGMPLEFAKKVYGATHLGDRVIITDGRSAGVGDSLGE